MNPGNSTAKETKKAVHTVVADALRIKVQETLGREAHKQLHKVFSNAKVPSIKAAVNDLLSQRDEK